MTEPEAIPIKIVIVGDGVVGKTCILTTYTQNKFPEEYVPTVFDTTTVTIKVDNINANISLWDTAGQQEYDRLRNLAYPSADAFLIIFSVADPSTFTNAKKKWFPDVTKANEDAVKIFVGNKIDLRANTNPTTISKQTARKQFQQGIKCKYYECSALTREGIPQLFQNTVREVISYRNAHSKKKQGNRKAGQDSGCCQLI